MDKKHYNELIMLSQEIYDQAFRRTSLLHPAASGRRVRRPSGIWRTYVRTPHGAQGPSGRVRG